MLARRAACAAAAAAAPPAAAAARSARALPLLQAAATRGRARRRAPRVPAPRSSQRRRHRLHALQRPLGQCLREALRSPLRLSPHARAVRRHGRIGALAPRGAARLNLTLPSLQLLLRRFEIRIKASRSRPHAASTNPRLLDGCPSHPPRALVNGEVIEAAELIAFHGIPAFHPAPATHGDWSRESVLAERSEERERAIRALSASDGAERRQHGAPARKIDATRALATDVHARILDQGSRKSADLDRGNTDVPNHPRCDETSSSDRHR